MTNSQGAVSLTGGVFATDSQAVQQRIAGLFQSDYSATTGLGTLFKQRLQQGGLLTDAGVQSEFALAAGMVMRSLGDQSGQPADLRVTRIQLASYARSGEQLQLSLGLVMADNSTKMIPNLTIA